MKRNRLLAVVQSDAHSPVADRPFVALLVAALCVLCLASCKPAMHDVVGVYSGCIQQTAERTAEYFLQLYGNGQYALRVTPYENPVKSTFRLGTWTFDGSLLILITEGEKDERFIWEHTSLRSEASSQAFPGLDRDQVSLRRVSW